MTTITLRKPIQAHGEEVAELTLREPEAGDIIACGYPLQMSDGAATPLAGPIAKYIERLGGIPAGSVRKMSPADFNACMQVILGFFGDADAGPSPGSGG
jgi:hypothetical protein